MTHTIQIAVTNEQMDEMISFIIGIEYLYSVLYPNVKLDLDNEIILFHGFIHIVNTIGVHIYGNEYQSRKDAISGKIRPLFDKHFLDDAEPTTPDTDIRKKIDVTKPVEFVGNDIPIVSAFKQKRVFINALFKDRMVLCDYDEYGCNEEYHSSMQIRNTDNQ
ncbi:MAG: hypothetical protein JNL32_00115 [Candidatus Kapabacteria bacterium]|nr:hypothetical protein [Candidatus Kapabacteria bacterium]